MEDVHVLRNFKHIGIKYHYVRDLIVNKTVHIRYTPSA